MISTINREECLRFLHNKPIPPIKKGSVLTKEDIEYIVESTPNSQKMKEIFESNSADKSKYTVEMVCDVCESPVETMMRPDEIKEYLRARYRKRYEPLCFGHAEARMCDKCFQEKRKKDYQIKQQEASKRQNITDDVIKFYLFPGLKFKDYSRCNMWDLSQHMRASDKERVADHIKSMRYYDFLTTLYWQIIARHLKFKRKECLLCSSRQNLRTHHNTYDLHGYEHTPDGLQTLIVLCDECHSRHHGKLKEKAAIE